MRPLYQIIIAVTTLNEITVGEAEDALAVLEEFLTHGEWRDTERLAMVRAVFNTVFPTDRALDGLPKSIIARLWSILFKLVQPERAAVFNL